MQTYKITLLESSNLLILRIKELMLKYWRYSLLLFLLAGCDWMIPPPPAANELLDGPVEGLSNAENARFLAGDRAFNDVIFTEATGLGPVFVATSCGSCHPGDGKGHPFTTLTRFGQTDGTGNSYIGRGGPQLQNRALPGYTPETVPAGTTFSKLTPPANTGLGFLAALTDAQILANEDPADEDGDGISGVANYINAPYYFIPTDGQKPVGGKYVGRFGKKAAALNLMHQTVNAYNQDIGITSEYENIDPYTHQIVNAEVDEKTINDVVFYLRTLKAPVPRGDNVKGLGLFQEIGCAKCHVAEWTTPLSDINALSQKIFHPYTDLLLHDMGPQLDDGYTEGSATTAEWRTPPLWGLGLSPNSQGGHYYLMHDGRAHSIEEAIQMHGGEGNSSRQLFELLSDSEKQALLEFLSSL
jgi:CxxC motif-containing protein (DUF1111 family)